MVPNAGGNKPLLAVQRLISELDEARAALAVLEASEACPCCLRRYEQHEDWCALWAVQRAIEGESARRASEGP